MKQDLSGWLGVIHGPLAQLQDSKNAIKQYADQMNKDSNFQTIVLAPMLKINLQQMTE
jgi:hypothetical protein